jgi:hypothetical protein
MKLTDSISSSRPARFPFEFSRWQRVELPWEITETAVADVIGDKAERTAAAVAWRSDASLWNLGHLL